MPRRGLVFLQPMTSPKRFNIPPPDWGMLRRSMNIRSDFSLKTKHTMRLDTVQLNFVTLDLGSDGCQH